MIRKFYIYFNLSIEIASNRLEGLLDYQTSEIDYVTDIFIRKIENNHEFDHLLRWVSKNFKIKSPIIFMIYCLIRSIDSSESQSKKSKKITFMIDLDTKESYIQFLTKVKHLIMNKNIYHFLLVSLVKYYLSKNRQVILNNILFLIN